MLKTVQQTLSCATEMLFVRLWRGPAAASAFPDTLEMEKYALVIIIQGRIQHFCQERGCTRLLLYFNTNKPHSVFFAEYRLYQKTAGHLSGGCAPPAPSPLDPPLDKEAWFRTRRVLLGFIVVTLQERESSQLPCLSIETTFGISCVLLEIIQFIMNTKF